MTPVTPLPDTLCVPPPPSTTAQSAKRARTCSATMSQANPVKIGQSRVNPVASGSHRHLQKESQGWNSLASS
ncbi:hypothetical protein B0T09DRAFT_331883 [Sordaria sp. MPI-SDFR-AT-0083]|nr:hypothetical protein B0T09DRAFT_331883 [Sordaria sp. MPI-SDFR-AT-0083]